MKHVGYIELPEHRGAGGFDHADVHAPSDRLYVAHTGNDAMDVIMDALELLHTRYSALKLGEPAPSAQAVRAMLESRSSPPAALRTVSCWQPLPRAWARCGEPVTPPTTMG